MDSTHVSRMLADRYRLDAVLGEGGMGIVYRGFDTVIGRPVAIKLLRDWARATSGDATRMVHEMRATAKVKSAHSVTLFDVGVTAEGDPFLVMSLVEGESLESLLERERTVPVERAVAVALQVSEALAAAHAVGIVHRDVKPANIMLSPAPAGDHATVLDFGIAKHLDQSTILTQAGSFVGTLEYVAPEQIAGEAIDGRADQYALAVTVVRMISGESLFPDTDLASMVHRKLLKVPPRLRERAREVPIGLDTVLGRALQREVQARYPDMSTFAAAMREAMTPVGAERHPSTESPQLASVPARGSVGDASEMEFDGDASLELALAPGPAPARAAASSPAVAPLVPRRPEEAAQSTRGRALRWLAPAVWKRVLAYSALTLLLGNACFRGFSSTSTIILGLGILLGVVALGLHAWLVRR